MGLKTAAEIFADRAYMEDLSLVPRKQPGSMITDEDLAVERCIKMIKERKVTAITGKEIEIQGDTLCVHGDGAKALAFVERIRKEFEAEASRSGTSSDTTRSSENIPAAPLQNNCNGAVS